MQNKRQLEPDPESKADPDLVSEIIYYYTLKKKETYSKYTFVANAGTKKDIDKAAILCAKAGITADRFVSIAYENFGGKKAYFTTSYLQGPKMTALLAFEKIAAENKANTELTRDVINFDDVWRQQIELANLFVKQGDAIEEILLDPSIKFYGWFRILATPTPVPAIMQRYRHVARKELTPRLKEYLKLNNFELDRIL